MLSEKKIFGVPHPEGIQRNTVVAVIYDSYNKKFLYTDWSQYGLCCLLSWGIEAGEHSKQALIREIEEESGYYNYSLIELLWGQIETHYYMSEKREHRIKIITSYLVVLENLERKGSRLEEDEKFELRFASYEELLELMRWYKNIDWWGLEDHIEILIRARQILNTLSLL